MEKEPTVTQGGIGGQEKGSGVPGVAAVPDGGISVEGVAAGNYEGCGHSEHRTAGPHRAWCFDCSEWCYRDPEMFCPRGELLVLRPALESVQAELRDVKADHLEAVRYGGELKAARDSAEAKVERLRTALVEAAVPLETLHASVTWELAPEVRGSIANAVAHIRAALFDRSLLSESQTKRGPHRHKGTPHMGRALAAHDGIPEHAHDNAGNPLFPRGQ